MSRPDPTRILVALLMPIGDMLFCQPSLIGLRHRFPHAQITALVVPAIVPLIDPNPVFDDVIPWTPDANKQETVNQELLATWKAIHAQHFDLVISYSAAGNWLMRLTFIRHQIVQRLPLETLLFGIPPRRGYRERHAIEHYWNVIAPLGIYPQQTEDHFPQWTISEIERDDARRLLATAGVQRDSGRPLVMLHPGAMGFGKSKRWPVASFGELAQELIATHDAQIVVIGGPEDVVLAETIVTMTGGRAISLAGQTKLRGSIALIANADAYVGCDTGMTHYAVALDIPTVALFGISSVQQFAPRARDPQRLSIVQPEPSQPPIGFFIGTESLYVRHHYERDTRMASITVARALSAVRELLPIATSAKTVPTHSFV